MFWGITPALDLLKELEETRNVLQEEINILLIGGSDARHILKTMARKYRHKKAKINFYVVETALESIGKQLLLLNIALQPPEELGLVQKTRFFMELFGNSILRPAVAKYLTTSAQQFVKMITNQDYMKCIMPFVNMDIKYKDRDYLENLFKFWCSQDEFNIFEYWDKRLRKTLGIRYDTKAGAFDWDLHMRYHIVGGSHVCNQEYQHFRKTGIAFAWIESEVSKPNRSMVCGIIPNGKTFGHYGYLGDMVTGPFVAYGLECEDPKFLKSHNGKNSHRATDITERNLMQIFHEIQTGQEYTHTQISDLHLGTIVAQLASINVVDVGAGDEGTKLKHQKCIDIDDITVNILSYQLLKLMKHKKQYHNFFDLIYFNSLYMKHFDSDVIKLISRDEALLLIENEIFILSNRDKQMEEYGKIINEKIQDLNCEKFNFNVLKDNYAKIILRTN